MKNIGDKIIALMLCLGFLIVLLNGIINEDFKMLGTSILLGFFTCLYIIRVEIRDLNDEVTRLTSGG